ncbi:MAG: hypothetical protein JXR39_06800, partial [Marinilabiliaceae bacterium]|nr:hypothetical protein [Marinilabiliaceae bacterium]
ASDTVGQLFISLSVDRVASGRAMRTEATRCTESPDSLTLSRPTHSVRQPRVSRLAPPLAP